MSTFLFVSIPVPAHTTNPMPFAARLVERGHTVLWLAGRSFHDRLRQTGARPLTYTDTIDFGGQQINDAFPQFKRLSGVSGIRRAFADVFVGQADARVRDIQGVLKRYPVDAMLTDGISYGPGLVHELGGPPWATYGDGPLPFEDADTPPFGPGLLPMRGPVGRARNRIVARVGRRLIFGDAQRRWDEIRTQLGLPLGTDALAASASPLLHIQGCMPGFDYPLADPPGHLHWVGALRPDPLPWAPPHWWEEIRHSNRPVVFVSQGSIRPDTTELLVPTIRALAELDVTVVVATGAATPAEVRVHLPAGIPGNCYLTTFVPYDEMLSHADCFVTNGGYTGVTLALAHGTPIVQAGTTEEKSEVGARVAWSGAGIRLGTTRPRPGQLRRAVLRVLDQPHYRVAAERLRLESRYLNAGSMGADLLEELARTGQPVLRVTQPRDSGRLGVH